LASSGAPVVARNCATPPMYGLANVPMEGGNVLVITSSLMHADTLMPSASPAAARAVSMLCIAGTMLSATPSGTSLPTATYITLTSGWYG
jgi:hypothetical protein